MGLRPSHRSLRHVDRLPRADDRLRRREDRRGEPSPHAGHAHRHADARRTRTRARPARGAGAATAAGAGSRRLAERAQSGFERKRARRGAEGRPGDQHRGDQRCGGRGRAAHARQPRGLRAGTRRGAGHPRGRRRRLGGRAAGPVSFSLVDPVRMSRHLEVPAYRCEGGGEVVVAITVDRDGKVVGARAREGGDECMRECAVESARRSRFNIDPSAPARQTGTITYIFIPQ